MLFRKGDLMTDIELAHLFPEWVLSWSLHQACKDASEFWNLPILHSIRRPENPKAFSTLFPSLTKAPMLCFEEPFRKEEAEIYGIPEINHERILLGLSPDFVIKDEDGSFIILLESRSGDKPEKIYSFPKERSCYEFLRQCNKITNRGFYYIIPKVHVGICKFCLAEYFPEEPNLHSGFICWEDLLSIIGDEITRVVLNEVSKEMEGLKKLREYQKKLTNRI
jgi:hypothetical protein